MEPSREGLVVMVGAGKEIKTTSYIENLLAAHMFLLDRAEPGIRGWRGMTRRSPRANMPSAARAVDESSLTVRIARESAGQYWVGSW